MPVREIGIRGGVQTNRMCGIRDVEQQSIAAARATCSADLRVQSDVMALARARTRASFLGRILAYHFVHDGLKLTAQLRAIGGGWSASSTSCLDDLLQLRGDEAAGRNLFLAEDCRGVSTTCADCVQFFFVFGDVHCRLAVAGRFSESRENARRGYDRGLLGMSERHFDHLDAEQCGVGVLLRREADTSRELVRRPDA